MSTSEHPKVLRKLVDELRDERMPEPDWSAIEQKLFARLDAEPAPVPAPPAAARLGLRHAMFAVAAAAAIVLGIRANAPAPHPAAAKTPPEIVDGSALPEAPGVPGALDLLALQPGDVIETSDASTTFAELGSVRFTLAPSSRAVVRVRGVGGVGHVIALESGSVRAEVTPRAPSEGLVEAFAVEAGGTRVAVHGTAFSVSRSGSEVLVNVEHGAVAVGPVGHVGDTNGHLLVGPARAAFSLDGGRTARWLTPEPPPAEAASSRAEPVAAQAQAMPSSRAERDEVEPAPTSPSRGGARVEPPAAPSAPAASSAPSAAAAPAVLTPASVSSMLARCFDQTYGRGSPSVRLSIASTFRITLRPDGSLQAARFDPPLEPAFQSCAGAIYAGRFAPGPASVDVPVAFAR